MGFSLDGVNINSVELDGVVFSKFELEGQLLLAPPTITTQPAGKTIKDNETHKMSVVAQSLGGDYTYQWYKDDTIINGATNAEYTHPTSPKGSYSYKVEVGNRMGKLTSDNAVVVVEASFSGTHTLVPGRDANGSTGYAKATLGNLTPRTINGFEVQNLTTVGNSNDIQFFVGGKMTGKNVIFQPEGLEPMTIVYQFYLSVTNQTYFQSTNATVAAHLRANIGKSLKCILKTA